MGTVLTGTNKTKMYLGLKLAPRYDEDEGQLWWLEYFDYLGGKIWRLENFESGTEWVLGGHQEEHNASLFSGDVQRRVGGS